MSSTDAADLRNGLVDQLIGDGRLRHDDVAQAVRAVPRHLFLPGHSLQDAYADQAVVTHTDERGMPCSSASQPAIIGVMLGQLEVRPGHRILEIGAGTGYNAALLATLTGPSGSVVTVDIDPAVATQARTLLDAAGFKDVDAVCADAWTESPTGPFDRIVATVGVWDLSPRWVESLVDDGLLVVPLSLRGGVQASIAFRRDGRNLRSVSIEACGFMLLRGAGAGPEKVTSIAGGWHVTDVEGDGGLPDRLQRLLAQRLVEETVELPARDWFSSIVLAHRGAVAMGMPNGERFILRQGIADPSGLALVETVAGECPPSGRLLRCGDPAVAEELRRLIDDNAGFDLRRITVEAVPSDQPGSETPALAVLDRPQFRYVLATP